MFNFGLCLSAFFLRQPNASLAGYWSDFGVEKSQALASLNRLAIFIVGAVLVVLVCLNELMTQAYPAIKVLSRVSAVIRAKAINCGHGCVDIYALGEMVLMLPENQDKTLLAGGLPRAFTVLFR